MFAGCSIGTGDVVGNYNMLLVHADLCGQKKLKKYGKVTMVVTVAQLLKWAFVIPGTTVDRSSVEQTSSIDPELFKHMRYIILARYL